MHDYDIKRYYDGQGVVKHDACGNQSVQTQNSDETVRADGSFELFDNRRDFYFELELKARYGEYYDESVWMNIYQQAVRVRGCSRARYIRLYVF